MNFNELKTKHQQHITEMLNGQNSLFMADIDTDALWNLYLDSFPPGTNEIYRERREYDCSCCRHFVKAFGGVVAISGLTVKTIWDFVTGDSTFDPVLKALSRYVKSRPIKDVFFTKEIAFGIDRNFELPLASDRGAVKTWEHFYFKLPSKFTTRSHETIGSLTGAARDVRNVFKRSLDEISSEAVSTVLELISQKSLYKGDEWAGALTAFKRLQDEYQCLDSQKKELFCWAKSVEVGGAIGKIRNHSIGTLIIDLSDDVEINEAVRKYEAIVAPSNYKRPKAIFTQAMIDRAQAQLASAGLLGSLGRRHATLEDITVNNILFANRDVVKKLKGNAFTDLKPTASGKTINFDKVEKVPIELFVESVLPTLTGMEILFENKHAGNLLSLIAPQDFSAPSLFKWDNGFSWAYNGNITDSMKERVKAAGGKVDGVLRFSIQWNDNGDNNNDFDAHCVEPDGFHIYFATRGCIIPSTGTLDVDIVYPAGKVAVENITWSNELKMQNGKYKFYVLNYGHRGGRTGFSAEIEYNGQTHRYEYPHELRQKEEVVVAELFFMKETGIEFIYQLPSTLSTREVWGLDTNKFYPVSTAMLSPNYWDGQSGIGHKHYFFMINGCLNDTQPNGFFNEFLREEFMPHKKVFEALGGQMKVEKTDNQLSGLGFSSTQRNEVVCRCEGAFNRTIKLIF